MVDTYTLKYVKGISVSKADYDALQASHARLLEALSHMRWCSTCAEGSWEDCVDGGRNACEAIAAAQTFTEEATR